jgi:beta-glucosidase
VHLGARELREVFARPFLAAIQEAGLASVMNAYNDVDGLPCGGSREILDELLRGELGFEGLVVADYFTTVLLIASHRVAADKGDAAQMALEAGLDMELPALDCYAELVQRVKSGAVDVSLVDRSARRVLRLKFELGLFEEPAVDAAAAAQVYQTPAVRSLARELAARSMVLLKNDGGLLPLSPDTRRIAVLGPCADDVRLLQGDYHYPAHAEITYRRGQDDLGSILPRSDGESAFQPGPWYPPTVTPLEGIRAAAPDAEISHASGCEVIGDDAAGIGAAVALAAACDVAVLCVGGRSGLMPDCSVGEFRDSASLELPGVQRQLVEQVLATGTPSVVVIISGRVHALPWLAELAPALLYAFVPGEEGGHGLADLLFGHESPSGRLPVSLPRHVGQVPLYHSRKWLAEGTGAGPFSPHYVEEQAAPLFPFGHGLGYASFAYADLFISPEEVAAEQAIEVSLRVTNTSSVGGCEVVQLYAQDPVASVTRPVSQLVGFARVELEAGETRRVSFRLDTSQLAFYDRAMRFVVEPGEIRVRVGASSADLRLEGRFRIAGEKQEVDPRRIVATRAEIT